MQVRNLPCASDILVQLFRTAAVIPVVDVPGVLRAKESGYTLKNTMVVCLWHTLFIFDDVAKCIYVAI